MSSCGYTINIYAANVDIPCPAVIMIHNTASQIDQVGTIRGSKSWSAWTSKSAFSENGIKWNIEINRILAESKEEALEKARAIASNIELKKTTNARFNNPYYFCEYGYANLNLVGEK